MSRFTVTSPEAELFSAPALSAARLAVPAGTAVEAEPVADSRIWLQTGPIAALPGAPSGFMRKADLTQAGDLPPEPVADVAAFLALADEVARDIGVDRDYLVALAWAESDGLSELGDAGSPGIGPFRFTEEAWKLAIEDKRAAGRALAPASRRLWRDQVPMAAVAALQANDRLAGLGKPPTLGTLYFAHAFGAAAAEALLADPAKPFDETYEARFGADPLAACRAARADVLGPPGGSVQSALDALCARLDKAYVAAAPVLDAQRDDIRFFHAELDDPRWLMVAREEAFRGVFEHPGADNNPRISEYLKVSGLANSADEVPWCGAFVAFCLKRSGDAAAAASVPAGAARAANWLSWGSEAPEGARGPGTVVVLKPQAANSSGHVGFLLQESAGDGAPAGKLRLLAGNQGQPQRVCALDFDEDQVADHGYRMFRPGAPPPPPEPRHAPAPHPGPGPVPAGGFRALVPGGFFSSNPNGPAKRSIRANNPGALNFSPWQAERKGFFGKTQPDNTPGQNVTTIYLTPEHGVASWFTLLAVRYKLGRTYSIRTLAARYAGSMLGADRYVTAWVKLSHGALSPSSVIDPADDAGMLTLAKAMFHNEAGEPTPLHDDQILFGIRRERDGTLPA